MAPAGVRHVHGSAQASAQKSWDTSSTSVDEATKQKQQQIFDAAQASGQAGPSSLTTDAAGYGTAMQGAGANGLAALNGDAAATQQLMNPYQQQVIDANNANWNKVNQGTVQSTNDAATRAGAFGGGRAAVTQGAALGANALAQSQQTAGLLQGGYSDAMSRANTLAGYGAAGAAGNANLGLAGVGSPEQWYAQQLKGGYLGSTGSTTGSTQTGVSASAKFGAGI